MMDYIQDSCGLRGGLIGPNEEISTVGDNLVHRKCLVLLCYRNGVPQ